MQRFDPFQEGGPPVVVTTAPVPAAEPKPKPKSSRRSQVPVRKHPARKHRGDYSPEDALARALNHQSVANYVPIFEGFTAKGIPMADIKPRENVFTFHAWLAKGRVVRKGEKGVKITTMIPVGETNVADPDTGETVKGGRNIFKSSTVFHISQTEPLKPGNSSHVSRYEQLTPGDHMVAGLGSPHRIQNPDGASAPPARTKAPAPAAPPPKLVPVTFAPPTPPAPAGMEPAAAASATAPTQQSSVHPAGSVGGWRARFLVRK